MSPMPSLPSSPSSDKSAAPVPVRSPIDERIEDVRKRKAEAELGGGEGAIRRQKKRGKLTARERLEKVVGPGSFNEADTPAPHLSPRFGNAGKRAQRAPVGGGWGAIEGPTGR